MTVFAHIGGGHWYELVIYFLPLLLIVATLGFESWRQRRRASNEQSGSDGETKERKP